MQSLELAPQFHKQSIEHVVVTQGYRQTDCLEQYTYPVSIIFWSQWHSHFANIQFDWEYHEKLFMSMETSNPRYAAEPPGITNDRWKMDAT